MLFQATLVSLLIIFTGLLCLDQVKSIGLGKDSATKYSTGINLKGLGDKKFENKQYNEALEYYKKAIEELEVDNSQESRRLVSVLYYSIAVIHVVVQDTNYLQLSLEACDKALSNCERFRCEASTIIPYAFFRAELYTSLGEYDYALADYLNIEDAASLNSNNELFWTFKNKAANAIRELINLKSKSDRPKNHYEILNIDPGTSSLQDIKRAYKKLALIHHPDKYFNSSNRSKELHAEKFGQIQEAHNVLSDPARKSDYDQKFMRNRLF